MRQEAVYVKQNLDDPGLWFPARALTDLTINQKVLSPLLVSPLQTIIISWGKTVVTSKNKTKIQTLLIWFRI